MRLPDLNARWEKAESELGNVWQALEALRGR